MNETFRYQVDSEGIGRLIFDLPGQKVNTLSEEVLVELSQILDRIADDKNVKALLIVSGKEDSFIAGADLKKFEGLFDNPPLAKKLIDTGHHVFNKLSNLKVPTIAVIHGVCLGGGLEFALACKYRIVTDHPKTALALPETTLGIIPGWGGTQRLPRLVGLANSLDMLLSGRNIRASQARKMKLADVVIPWEFREEKSVEFARKCMTEEGQKQILKNREIKGFQHFLLEKNPIGRHFLFKKARQKVLKKTQGHYPAPIIALELVERTFDLPLAEGLKEEGETFIENGPSAFGNAKNIIAFFFNHEAVKKNPGFETKSSPLPLSTVNVLGAGTMGSVIAWLLSNHDYWVRMKDISWELIGKGLAHAQSLYQKLVKDKRLKATDANMKFHHLSGTIDYSGFQNADLVIEAATENLELKHKIFKELEENVPTHTIIASNTSSLTIAEMSEGMKHPERFIGMHFFNPPNKMPLVEIVPGKKTTPETVATAISLCRKLGKTPLVVGDCAGFLVNRIFAVHMNEAIWMLEEGVPLEVIDKAMTKFGMPMGPFTVADEVGNDVCYKVGLIFEKAYGERLKFPPFGQTLYDAHLSGKKIGKGFYLYNGKEKKVNPEIAQLVGEKEIDNLPEKTIVERIVFMMINEAMRCLEEGIVKEPAHVDVAVILGIGFPPFRGGLLRYADHLTLHYVLTQMKHYQEAYGTRFTPCKLLEDMGEKRQKFF